MPSYGPPTPTLPFANMAVGVFKPIARPPALDGRTFGDKPLLGGRLAFAVESFVVVASAFKSAM